MGPCSSGIDGGTVGRRVETAARVAVFGTAEATVAAAVAGENVGELGWGLVLVDGAVGGGVTSPD